MAKARGLRALFGHRPGPALIKYERESLDGTDLLATENLLRARGYRLHQEGPDTIAAVVLEGSHPL